MTDKQINGIKSELLAEYYLISKGYIVSKPINDFLNMILSLMMAKRCIGFK